MANYEMIIAGFGGQGLLFSGKVLAYAGLLENRELSWLPSYGPEMRGGTANCNVILSDTPVGSPIVQQPNVLMVMNTPSLDKYENDVVPGGKIFIDSSLISRKVVREDVEAYYIPATKMAQDMGVPTLANMILLGAIIANTGCVQPDTIAAALHKVIPARKADLFDVNMQAIEAGKAFVS
ncbi:MAG: 2-oxoacid:acceptor oxidoreductase family protein [Clostridia bacterium]|nr:2-oxoacid:acceptor oxidoreductase family protein [Clostridia bacterium]